MSTTVLVDLLGESMTAVVDTMFGERHGAFGRAEEMFEMIRFALVVLVLFVSEKNALFFHGLVVIT